MRRATHRSRAFHDGCPSNDASPGRQTCDARRALQRSKPLFRPPYALSHRTTGPNLHSCAIYHHGFDCTTWLGIEMTFEGTGLTLACCRNGFRRAHRSWARAGDVGQRRGRTIMAVSGLSNGSCRAGGRATSCTARTRHSGSHRRWGRPSAAAVPVRLDTRHADEAGLWSSLPRIDEVPFNSLPGIGRLFGGQANRIAHEEDLRGRPGHASFPGMKAVPSDVACARSCPIGSFTRPTARAANSMAFSSVLIS